MIISFGSSLLSDCAQELRAGDGMKHPLEIVLTRHYCRERDKKQSEHEQGSAPATGGSPECEGENETDDGCDQRAPRSALAQSHGNEECARRLVTEGTNDEGWNKEQSDGGEGAEEEQHPDPAGGVAIGLISKLAPELVLG